jgi:hypothetical protein
MKRGLNVSNLQFRPLRTNEREILLKLISAVPAAGEGLRSQVNSCAARELDEYGSLELTVPSPVKLLELSGPIVSAMQEDTDTIPTKGPYINFILFARNGVINELQIYKDDGGAIKSAIDPSRFTFI